MPKNSGNVNNPSQNNQPKKPLRFEMSHLRSKVEDFKDNYGIEVSCEKYVEDVERKIQQARNGGGEVDVAAIKNEVFLDTVKELYKEYVWGLYIKDKLTKEGFDADLFDDFHEIIHMYSATEKRAAYFGEVFELEMTETEKAQVIYDGVKELQSKSPAEKYKDLYKNGDLSIRDMREYVKSLEASKMKDEEIATAFQAAQALREVNEGRSFWWRVFHPFRNNAEKRDAKLIEDTIVEKIVIMQAGKESSKGIQWYRTFANEYQPLEIITEFGNDVKEAWEDVSEVGDDAYRQDGEEISEDEISFDGKSLNDISEVMPLKEEEENSFDMEIKEEVNGRQSLNIVLENKGMEEKSPFIDSKSMNDPVIKNGKM